MDEDSNIAALPSPPGTIITPRGASEPREVLDARERAQFRLLVLAEATRVADLHRYKSLMTDRRSVRAQLSCIEEELKEIEGRIPRHVLKP